MADQRQNLTSYPGLTIDVKISMASPFMNVSRNKVQEKRKFRADL